MTLNDKLPLSQTDDGPSGAGQAGAAVRAAAEKQPGGGVLQHLEDLEDEAEPPEKKLQQQQQPLGRKFTILSKIGEGGYGNVYTVKKVGESSENDSGRIYALKVGHQVLCILIINSVESAVQIYSMVRKAYIERNEYLTSKVNVLDQTCSGTRFNLIKLSLFSSTFMSETLHTTHLIEIFL